MAHALIYRGETRRRVGAIADAHADFAAALQLARALTIPEEAWKALYGLGRTDTNPAAAAAHLDEAIDTIEQIREAIRIPSRRSDFLNDKREVFDARIAANLAAGGDVAAVFALLERSHSRGWRERLGLSAAVSLQAVQAALPDDGLLLDYWHADTGAAVIVVTHHRAEIVPIRAPAADVAGYAERWATSPEARDARAVARMDLLPQASWFAGIRHVIVVPDGSLSLVPFEVLTVADRPLIERAAVSYLPTAAALLRAVPALPWRLPPWHTMLRAFGDPVVGDSALDDAARVRGRIAATGREVRAIASEIAGRSDLHLGTEDRKDALFAGHVPPLLHLATHALADTQSIEQSRILFSPPRGLSPATADYLFLREVYDLTLDGVDLAVLSACETERGRLVRGEGVESFSRAFLAAGARSTVTTLWRVEDEPTADFMAIFYHQLQRGASRDEALRQAKLRFIESGSSLADPHYWAAFVLNGDALRPIPRALAWKTVALAGMAMTALVVLVRAVRRARPAL